LSDPESIYIHVPFCIKKCVYCDFYSQTDLSLIPGYLRALGKEIEKKAAPGNTISTLYFGGGTPSVLRIKDIEKLLQILHENYSVSPEAEITLEVNPGTVDAAYLKELSAAGINRLSIGVQSFCEDKLKFLNRIHSARQAVKTIHHAQNAGFDNISLDLIYGLPFETKKMWQSDLKEAVTMMSSHLSCYMLTIEPGTPLGDTVKKGLITPVDNDTLSKLFKDTVQFLDRAGFEQYEISNFSKGHRNRSKHNSNYWNMTPYHGFGPAAHSYDGITRSWNQSNIIKYINKMDSGRLPLEEKETLTCEQKMMEMILLSLRTLEGVDLIKFEALFHLSFEDRFKDILGNLLDACLGVVKDNRFFLTLEGKLHLNSIVEAFADKIL